MEEIKLDPEPGILIESLRDIGYSFNSALADIIDNSISAGATEIQILAIPADDFKICIVDNGEGLTRENLMNAMRLGSADPRQKRSITDLGRFGLGLKTASFSQCRKLTVVSKQGGYFSAFTWDLDFVVKNNKWTVLAKTDPKDTPFIDELALCNSGTLVLWEKVDRITGSRGSGKIDYTRLISEAQDYLSLVFHRYLAGELGLRKITISLNKRILEPIDPFNTKHKATQSSQFEVICPGVTMQAFTLPHKSHYDSLQEYEKYGLEGGYLKNQGVYLYRAKRLILYGTWFGLAKKTALTQLTRVKIDIDVNQDEQWKIDVKKVSAQLPEIVRVRLKNLVSTIGAPSKKTYTQRAVRLTNPEYYPVWVAERSGDKTTYKLNRQHPAIGSLCESLQNENATSLNAVLSLVEASFPLESLFVEFAKNEANVSFAPMDDSSFKTVVTTFFSVLKQQGKDEETILLFMKNSEPFMSKWEETLKALGIEEN